MKMVIGRLLILNIFYNATCNALSLQLMMKLAVDDVGDILLLASWLVYIGDVDLS